MRRKCASSAFSADARIFAFEEFGVQDGSGFPYSNIYLIDLERDKFAPGSPVRVTIEREAPLKEARSLAWAKTPRHHTRYGADVRSRRIRRLSRRRRSRRRGEVVRFNRYPRAPKVAKPYSIKLENKPFPPPRLLERQQQLQRLFN